MQPGSQISTSVCIPWWGFVVSFFFENLLWEKVIVTYNQCIKHPNQGTLDRNQTSQRLCGNCPDSTPCRIPNCRRIFAAAQHSSCRHFQGFAGKGLRVTTTFCMILYGFHTSSLSTDWIAMSNGSKLMHLCSFCKVLRSSVSRSCRLDEVTLPPMDIPEHNIGYIESQQKMSTKISQVSYLSTYWSMIILYISRFFLFHPGGVSPCLLHQLPEFAVLWQEGLSAKNGGVGCGIRNCRSEGTIDIYWYFLINVSHWNEQSWTVLYSFQCIN